MHPHPTAGHANQEYLAQGRQQLSQAKTQVSLRAEGRITTENVKHVFVGSQYVFIGKKPEFTGSKHTVTGTKHTFHGNKHKFNNVVHKIDSRRSPRRMHPGQGNAESRTVLDHPPGTAF